MYNILHFSAKETGNDQFDYYLIHTAADFHTEPQSICVRPLLLERSLSSAAV